MRGVLPAFLAAVAVLTFNCTARRTIPTGRYDQYAGPGTLLFSSHHLYFPGADSVKYVFFSDMVGSERYGKGRYRIAGNKLILTFDGTAPPPSTVQVTTKKTARDSLSLFFRVGTLIDSVKAPLPGINIAIQDTARKTITGTVTAKDGTAQLTMARSSHPRRVLFSFIGMQSVEYSLQDNDASFDVLLQAYYGHVSNAGQEITFGIAKIGDDRLVLKRGKDRIVFVKK